MPRTLPTPLVRPALELPEALPAPMPPPLLVLGSINLAPRIDNGATHAPFRAPPRRRATTVARVA